MSNRDGQCYWMRGKSHLVGPHWADDTTDLGVVLGLQVDGLALVVPVSTKTTKTAISKMKRARADREAVHPPELFSGE